MIWQDLSKRFNIIGIDFTSKRTGTKVIFFIDNINPHGIAIKELCHVLINLV